MNQQDIEKLNAIMHIKDAVEKVSKDPKKNQENKEKLKELFQKQLDELNQQKRG